MKTILIFTIIILLRYPPNVKGQSNIADSMHVGKQSKFEYSSLIVPTVLIGYGIIGLKNHAILDLNKQAREEVGEHIDDKLSIDDFSQYAPFLSAYALDYIGIKGKNNFKDKTVVLASAYIIMGATVIGLKNLCKVERPDGSSKNSFPSGHTATAFMGAEFLWQEYIDKSIWYGISGYTIAAGTGLFRILNNRHWISDVTMGAGIGMLSTKIAYWLNPIIEEEFFYKKPIIFIPYYVGLDYGIRLVLYL